MKGERTARILVGIGIAFPLAVAAIGLFPRAFPSGGPIEIHASVAEQGGWDPSELAAEAGAPLTLRLTSDDVVHGLAIGRSDVADVEVLPGQYTELTLTFDRPGRYTIYCTRWCGPGHWRMRGTIEVSGARIPVTDVEEPLYTTLGIDIDAPHLAEVLPRRRPSAAAGEALGAPLPAALAGRAYYERNSPSQSFASLREEPSYSWMDDEEVWDLVALLWRRNTTTEALEVGRQLFAQNCAACHGELGAGDGVMAGSLLTLDEDLTGEVPRPADFTSPEGMFGASPALLQGKILRGGMGTGMPYFGPIFTEAQIRALVDYLWTFTMEYEE
jgi:mono/diheme cytochrome c family protein/plastocyanin